MNYSLSNETTTINTTSNNKDACRTLFHKIHLLSDSSINVLITANILVAISNIVVNSMVMYLIYKTKQYQNSSLRLTLYMSCSDFLVGFISQHMLTIFLFEAHSKLTCVTQVIMQYILYIFPHMTGFFVGMVALDRYCRVKYTNRYNEIMTFKRQTIGIIFIAMLAILNCMVLISGIFSGNWLVALVGIQPLDMSFVTMDIVLYWRSITLMKEHMRNNAEMKNFSKSISKLASIYLVLVITFYPPYLLIDMIQAFINSSNTTLIFWHIMSLIWVFLNSGIDAISFLVVNRKARRQMNVWKEHILGPDKNAKCTAANNQKSADSTHVDV